MRRICDSNKHIETHPITLKRAYKRDFLNAWWKKDENFAVRIFSYQKECSLIIGNNNLLQSN